MKTLRERMIADMQHRNYSERTIDAYIRCVARLSKHFNRSPENISIDEIKDYLHHIIDVEKCGYVLVNQTINGVRLLFKDVLNRAWTLETIKRPKKKGHFLWCYLHKKLFPSLMLQLILNTKQSYTLVIQQDYVSVKLSI